MNAHWRYGFVPLAASTAHGAQCCAPHDVLHARLCAASCVHRYLALALTLCTPYLPWPCTLALALPRTCRSLFTLLPYAPETELDGWRAQLERLLNAVVGRYCDLPLPGPGPGPNTADRRGQMPAGPGLEGGGCDGGAGLVGSGSPEAHALDGRCATAATAGRMSQGVYSGL
jgi:hypothetical protein